MLTHFHPAGGAHLTLVTSQMNGLSGGSPVPCGTPELEQDRPGMHTGDGPVWEATTRGGTADHVGEGPQVQEIDP